NVRTLNRAGGTIMTTQTTATRPPLPPFTRETAIQKVRLAEDGWNTRDPEKVALAYAIDSRWRNRAEFPNGRQEIIQFLKRNGPKNWITGSSRNSGRLPGIVSLYGLLMSGMTIPVIGFALMEMKTGSSILTVSWLFGSPRSTISRSRNQIANITGRLAAGPMITRG